MIGDTSGMARCGDRGAHGLHPFLFFVAVLIELILLSRVQATTYSYDEMVLAQPPNQHVMKAFDLTGKVAVVTGTPSSPDHQECLE